MATTYDLDEHLFGAVEAGASGLLLKDCGPEELVASVHAAARGDAMVSPRMTRRVLAGFARRRAVPERTGGPGPRGVEPVQAPCEGPITAELAERLGIEVSTMTTHPTRICTRVDVRDRVHLVVWAHRHGCA